MNPINVDTQHIWSASALIYMLAPKLPSEANDEAINREEVIAWVDNEVDFTFYEIGVNLHIEGFPEHENPDSIWHWLLHPSPDTILPSSQFSGGVIIPFPHKGLHTLGYPTQ